MNRPDTTRRWLIIRSGAVGDTILLSPLIQVIRRSDPLARIELLGHKERLSLLVGNGLADRAVSMEELNIECLYLECTPLKPHLRDYLERFDCIIWFVGCVQDWMREKVRVKTEQWVHVRTALPTEQEQKHIILQYLKALPEFVRIEPVPPVKVHVSQEEKIRALHWFRKNNIREEFLIGLHVGAGSPKKWADLNLFVESVRKPEGNCRVLLIQGPADEEPANNFLELLPSGIPVTRIVNEPLTFLAAVLSSCNQFVGNDSGITHLAAAVGCNTTVYFVSSNPHIWAPVGDHVNVVDLRLYHQGNSTG
ncbi:MAG: glycosyltransferase family 9 protein [bacterium]|jgi:ADP-heptose:LPS heptosyltransferase